MAFPALISFLPAGYINLHQERAHQRGGWRALGFPSTVNLGVILAACGPLILRIPPLLIRFFLLLSFFLPPSTRPRLLVRP